jgi:predicted 2-oxoglutarate/Fe(II)-dependent dioxygenase YbiX
MSVLPGDSAPRFRAATSINPRFTFDTAAGRYVVITFFGSTQSPVGGRLLNEILDRAAARFDVTNVIFFGVTNDPQDVPRLPQGHPGRVYFFDLDFTVSKQFGLIGGGAGEAGVASPDSPFAGRQTYAPRTFVLDQSLRVIGIIGLDDGDDDLTRHADTLFSILDSLPPLSSVSLPAPVLVVPYVFEPKLCRTLIEYYQTKGGEDSGFMRDVDGKTVGLSDYTHKRRMDCEVFDKGLIAATQERIRRRVVPAIQQAFQFHATRIERHIVACYDAAQGAHFKAHRDNTTLGTAHRRFAITINLNSPEYEGGEIWFPEFARKRYKPASGAAIVFSCSLLHEVPRVTRGKRYAFLPFLYDEAAAEIRERNRKHLGDLSGASGAPRAPGAPGGGKPEQCAATPNEGRAAGKDAQGPAIDGTLGCGNPAGCGTCLSAAAYPLGVTASPSPATSSAHSTAATADAPTE